MMKDLIMDENMPNLTSASGEISASSGSRVETPSMYPQQQSFASTNQAPPPPPPPPPKKKRSLPGNPDPDADVIALSPKSLLATNRFVCEICNKGFQRDQNLQLHRRGHNLPWKLKQRNNKEVIRKKVYVCPESTCVHHDPSRALGDLTGIKKHFCRKHGEKKWKCEKCSKRYAVQSDWKAHSKICGTREYRCDCGTLFSRRDSFITHRAFCDALAEESTRAITVNHPLLTSSSSSQQHQLPGNSASHMINLQALSVKREQESHHLNIPPWFACGEAGPPPPPSSSSQLFATGLEQTFLHNEQHQNPSRNPNPNLTLPQFQTPTASPHMSATALLQKAAEMGVTMSKSSPTPALSGTMLRVPHQTHMSAVAAGPSGLGLSSREEIASGFGHGLAAASFGNKAVVTSSAGFMEQIASTHGGGHPLLHDHHAMLSSLSSATGFDGSSSFDEDFNGILNPKGESINFQETLSKPPESQFSRSTTDSRNTAAGGNDNMTRDFLGLKPFSHKDFLNITGLEHLNSSSTRTYHRHHQQQQQQQQHHHHHQQNQNQPPWQG